MSPFLKGDWLIIHASLPEPSSLGPKSLSSGLSGLLTAWDILPCKVPDTLKGSPYLLRALFFAHRGKKQQSLHCAPGIIILLHAMNESQESQSHLQGGAGQAGGYRADLCSTVLMGTRKLSSFLIIKGHCADTVCWWYTGRGMCQAVPYWFMQQQSTCSLTEVEDTTGQK